MNGIGVQLIASIDDLTMFSSMGGCGCWCACVFLLPCFRRLSLFGFKYNLFVCWFCHRVALFAAHDVFMLVTSTLNYSL
jgi:hypothetical protein